MKTGQMMVEYGGIARRSGRIATAALLCLICAIGLCACVPATGVEGTSSGIAEGSTAVESDDTSVTMPEVDPSANGPRARVLVTVDYGMEPVLDEMVLLDTDETAMDALNAVAEVGTAYGGGFVRSINGIGLPADSRCDWFFAVNGVLSNRGAAEHALRDGDVEHWDYRQWGLRHNVSATLGSVPAFLLNGFRSEARPTIVAFDTGFEAEAAVVVDLLHARGVTSAAMLELAQLPEEWQAERNLIVIGDFSCHIVREVFQQWDRLGLFCKLDDGRLLAYSAQAQETEFGASAGLLQPMQNPWNPAGIAACENILLLVTGTDGPGVRDAVEALNRSLDDMATWCGAIVSDGKLSPVPVGLQPRLP